MNGTPYKIGEREFIVPRMRVGVQRRCWKISVSAPESDPQAQQEAKLGILVEALRDNYPGLTVDELAEVPGFFSSDFDEVLHGVMLAAGRKPAPPGEAPAP